MDKEAVPTLILIVCFTLAVVYFLTRRRIAPLMPLWLRRTTPKGMMIFQMSFAVFYSRVFGVYNFIAAGHPSLR